MIRKIVEALFPGTVAAIKMDASAERDRVWNENTGIDIKAVLADREQQASLDRARRQAKGGK